jgi:hypothetical protein
MAEEESVGAGESARIAAASASVWRAEAVLLSVELSLGVGLAEESSGSLERRLVLSSNIAGETERSGVCSVSLLSLSSSAEKEGILGTSGVESRLESESGRAGEAWFSPEGPGTSAHITLESSRFTTGSGG